ncbi:unnamed protein product [Closterium sp. NIES-54]
MRADRLSLTRGLADSKDSVSLFDLMSGAATALPATADSATRSQWLTRDAAARLAIRNHLPLVECAHFGQHRTAQALYDAVVARYSLPATAALGRLILPYLFPELSFFPTVEDLVSHLHTNDARYRATVPAEFLDRKQPPMFITLYFIVTHLLDSLRSVRDNFLSLDPTSLTVDLLEQHLLAAETSAVSVGAARGTPRTPFFEGCSPSPLAPSYASAAAEDVPGTEDVGAASASAKRRSDKVKDGRSGGGGSGGGGGGSSGGGGGSGGGGSGGGGSGGSGGGSGSSGGGGGGSGGIGGSGRSGTGGGTTGAQRGGSGSCPYVIRTGDCAGQTCGRFHTQHCCFSRLDDAWRAEFGVEVERPHWADLLSVFTPTWHALPSPCLWSSQVSASPPALPSLRRGAQRAAPHSSSFPPTTAPLQTLHMDVWGPARVSGQGRERYFLVVVDDYTRYTTVFPLCSKGEVPDILIPWIRAFHLQLHERFGQGLPVQHLHSDRGGEFSSNLLRDFCCGEAITQSFMLPASPQQNGIAERCIGLVMEVARTSMIHAAAPHVLWPFAVRYAAHQLNLWPRVSLPETSPTLRWTGEVGDASVFRFWGCRAFVCDSSADKLSARAIPCVFLGFPPDAPGWQFYHPTSRCVLSSQDVTFDESVPFYRLFPYRSAPPPPLPLFLAPGPPPVDPLPPQGPAPSSVSHVDPLPSTVPVGVASDSSAARGAAPGGAEPGGAESEGVESGGAEPGGAEPGDAEPGGAEPAGVEPGGAGCEGAESGGAEPRGAASSGGAAGASPRLSPRPETLSPQQLHEWLVRHARLWNGAAGAGGDGDTGARRAGASAGAGGTGGTTTTGPGGARTRGTGAAGTGAGGAGAVDPRAVVAGAGGAGDTGARGTVRPRPFFVPLLQQPASTLPAPSPYTQQSCCLTERRKPASRPVLPVRTSRRIPRLRPPPVHGTHAMALLLLSLVVTDPSFESDAASALIAELLDFAAASRLDYPTALVAESESTSPPSIKGECALGTDVLEDRQEGFECLAAAVPRFTSMLLALEGDPDAPDIPTPRSYAEAITGPYSSQWQAVMDAEIAS